MFHQGIWRHGAGTRMGESLEPCNTPTLLNKSPNVPEGSCDTLAHLFRSGLTGGGFHAQKARKGTFMSKRCALLSTYTPRACSPHCKNYSLSLPRRSRFPASPVPIPLMKSTRPPLLRSANSRCRPPPVRRIQTHVNARKRERDENESEWLTSKLSPAPSALCPTVSQLSCKGRKRGGCMRRVGELLSRSFLFLLQGNKDWVG